MSKDDHDLQECRGGKDRRTATAYRRTSPWKEHDPERRDLNSVIGRRRPGNNRRKPNTATVG